MARLHPNVLKVRKQKRQGRRAYLTSVFNVVKVPRSVGKSDVPESSRPLFNYRDRGLGYYSSFIDVILPDIFGNPTKVEWPVHRPISEAAWKQAMDPKKTNGWKSEDFGKYGKLDNQGRLVMEKVNVGEVNGRRYTLQAAEEERLVALIQDPDVCDYITLRTSTLQKTRLTFVYNRQYTRCFFIEVTYAEANSFAMKSKVYGSRDRAIFDYEHKRISWSEFLELPTLSLVLPRRGTPD